MTPARKNDRSQMDSLIDETGITYVFDRGYVDDSTFDRYCDQGIFFVTRLKKNAAIRPIHSFKLPSDSKVLSDEMVYIGTPQKRMENVLRLIHTVDSEGNLLAIVTNRFDLEADEISEMYRKRWAIETFFKWMKQHIRIKSFYGTSERAVMNQVWIALIAFCLLVLAKQEIESAHPLLQLYRWLKVLLWKPCEMWLNRIKRRSSRTSSGRRKR
jgi:IS4 transposase